MNKMRSVPVLALCAIFLFLAVGAALLSTSVYRSVEAAAGAHSQERVTVSYLLGRLRGGDVAGTMRVEPFGDGDALILADGAYETRLYCYEGYLRELYLETGLNLGPEAGEALVEVQSLTVSLEGELLRLTVTEQDGAPITAEYHLQSSQQEVGTS